MTFGLGQALGALPSLNTENVIVTPHHRDQDRSKHRRRAGAEEGSSKKYCSSVSLKHYAHAGPDSMQITKQAIGVRASWTGVDTRTYA